MKRKRGIRPETEKTMVFGDEIRPVSVKDSDGNIEFGVGTALPVDFRGYEAPGWAMRNLIEKNLEDSLYDNMGCVVEAQALAFSYRLGRGEKRSLITFEETGDTRKPVSLCTMPPYRLVLKNPGGYAIAEPAFPDRFDYPERMGDFITEDPLTGEPVPEEERNVLILSVHLMKYVRIDNVLKVYGKSPGKNISKIHGFDGP